MYVLRASLYQSAPTNGRRTITTEEGCTVGGKCVALIRCGETKHSCMVILLIGQSGEGKNGNKNIQTVVRD